MAKKKQATCQHCGACETCDYCEHCRKCKACGRVKPFELAPTVPFPVQPNPFIVPPWQNTAPWNPSYTLVTVSI